MAVDLKEYVQLKKRVDQAKQKADKAVGALEQIMKQLKKNFGCNSLQEAEKKSKSLQKQAITSKKEFDEALEEFEEKWYDELQKLGLSDLQD